MAKAKSKTRTRRPRVAPRRRSGRKTISLAKTAGAANAIAQFVLPYANGQTAAAIKSGSYEGLPMAFHADSQEALKLQNLAEAALPYVGISIAASILNEAGIKSPRLGKFRVW